MSTPSVRPCRGEIEPPTPAAAARALDFSTGNSTRNSSPVSSAPHAQRVLQLPDIAGPVIAAKRLQRRQAYREIFLRRAVASFLQENDLPEADVLRAVAQGRNRHRDNIQAIVEVFRGKTFSATALSRSRLVAAITRTSIAIHRFRPPTHAALLQHGSNLDCMVRLISLISSRKIVPSCATSK
jgi:hypothetical protein